MLRITLIIFVLLGGVDAFQSGTPLPARMVHPGVTTGRTLLTGDPHPALTSSTGLAAIRPPDKKVITEEEKEASTSIGRLLSPLNPYMWFVYMFVFIFAADFVRN
jgi:hypothetical protein|mmetsp:Transcript_26724/g.69142  ORF Transcript_26724/g.69142 Transcript_26724/m.69142 type:complete len:105 (-) Transcript_26724:200-514(-)